MGAGRRRMRLAWTPPMTVRCEVPDVLVLLNVMLLTGVVCGIRAESGLGLSDRTDGGWGPAKPPPQ